MAALAVGEAALLQHLQQEHLHLAVRLLDLVQHHHARGPAAHGLGELAAVAVAHVARGRADEAGHAVGLGHLAHVQAHQRVAAAEEHLGQRARHLRLAHARGAQEEEASPSAGARRSPRSCGG